MNLAKEFYAQWEHWQEQEKNEEGPVIVCVPPGIHYAVYPKEGRAEQFSREDEITTRMSIYGLTEAEARWDDEPRTEASGKART